MVGWLESPTEALWVSAKLFSHAGPDTSAKSYLVGNFPTTIETPSQIAAQVGQVKLLGLDKSYLENYRKDVAKVTVVDSQAAMKKHLHPDQLAIILVGDATAIADKVAPIASVALYDIEGNAMSMDELAVYQVADGKVIREEFFYSM